MMKYRLCNKIPDETKVLELYKRTGFFNESWTKERMGKVLKNSTLLLCCYDGDNLIGIARGIAHRYR